MTWWLKAAEELKMLRQLGLDKPGSVIAGFLLDAPNVTIDGAAADVTPAAAAPPANAVPSVPAKIEPASPAPAAQNLAPSRAPRTSFLKGETRYKLHWEIRPHARKTASK